MPSAVLDHRRVSRDAIVIVALWAAAILVFFHQQIGNHFSVLVGDRFDGIIETSILEHWFNVLRGRATFSETNYFFGTRGTLGYNDGYLLYGLVYSLFRFARLNPFISSECVNMAVVSAGYFGFVYCARVVFRIDTVTCAFGGFLFATANSTFIQSGHAQLLSVAFAPWLAALIARAVEETAAGSGRRAFAFGLSAAGLHAAWLLTAFYMAWYFLYFGLWFVAFAVILHWRDVPSALATARRQAGWIAALAVIYLLINIPFFAVYIPKAIETGQHDLRANFVYIPSVLDIFNIGPDNLVFGRLYAALNTAIRPGFPDYGEKATGFPPVILFVFVAGAAWCLALRRGAVSGRILVAAILGAAILASWATALRIDQHSLWSFVWRWVPGAKAVRVVARFQIFLVFPVTLLVTYVLTTRLVRGSRPVLAIVYAALTLEQVSLARNVGLPVQPELARLQAVPTPPATCKSFFAVASREASTDPGVIEAIYSHNVDAMMIAEYIGLPTINGFATFTPAGWNLIGPNRREAYMADVKRYVDAHAIRDICSLDLRAMAWDADPLRDRAS